VVAADVAPDGTEPDGLLPDAKTAGVTGIRVELATSAATGNADGWTTGPDGLDPPEPRRGGLGRPVLDGLGLAEGADDGAAVGEAEGAGVLAVGEAEGAGGVWLGAGVGGGVVGAADGDGSVEESAGDGLGAGGAEAAAVTAVPAASGGADEDPGEATTSAAATPGPEEQPMAMAAPAVIAPRRMRARGVAPQP
jgi:hypothetical protein